MALINKIRQRSGWAIGFIAVGLIFFMVGGDIFSPNSKLMGGGPSVGKIDGNKVFVQDFQEKYRVAESNFSNQKGTSPNAQEQQQIRNQIWQSYIFDQVYQKEFDKLGIGVSYKEANAIVRGDSMFISPQMRQMPYFKDSTGKFDRKMVEQYILSVQNDPVQAANWTSFKQNIIQGRLAEKYTNIATKTNYVTTAEAKKFYESQETKTSVDYVYIPYSQISDSTVKVTEAELRTYANKHKDMYKAEDSRNIKYVTFSIAPSSKDTAMFMTDMQSLSQEFEAAKNDSSFALTKTEADMDPKLFGYKSTNELPKDLPSDLQTGKVYGPFVDGSNFSLIKIGGSKEGSPVVSAKHILFKMDTSMTAEEQEKVKTNATEVLQKIQNGEPFETMAKIHGSDGTKDNGGDLGSFGRGQMVKPFEEAAFAVTQAGLLPYLVKTDFGYHILHVTKPKSAAMLYQIATIKKSLEMSEESSNVAYAQAQEFSADIKSIADFNNKVAKKPTLIAKEAKRLSYRSTNVNEIKDGKDIIRWAYNDKTDIGTLSGVFMVPDENLYVVAVLTGKSEKDEISVDFFRDELTLKVKNEKKSKIILDKISKSKSLEAMAKAYGNGIAVSKAEDVKLSGNTIGSVSNVASAIGTASGLKKGATSKALVDDSGIVVVKVNGRTPAPEIADYSKFKQQIRSRAEMNTSYFINQALMEIYKVKNEVDKVF